MSSVTLLVDEIYGPVIQGEGPVIGMPTVFVRLGGCDYRCRWCDSLHAVLPENKVRWERLTALEVMDRIELLAGPGTVVTLSGGNPALQDLEFMIWEGRERGYRFAIETQGSRPQNWFSLIEHVVLSPKPPSAGIVTDWAALEASIAAAGSASVTLKVVVVDIRDYEFAKEVASRFPAVPLFLQVGNPDPAGGPVIDLMTRFRWLSERVCADRWTGVRVLPQLHVLAYGNERGR